MDVIALMASLVELEKEHGRQAERHGDPIGIHQMHMEGARRHRAVLAQALSDLPCWRRATGEHAA
jgi:hypothetical protein